MILSLHLDSASEIFFNDLRERYFPAELNFIPAHVTLFHNLPDDQVDLITQQIENTVRSQAAVSIAVTGLRSLGRGVAFTLESSALSALRGTLTGIWWDRLTLQDRQKFKPHVTVQNKVTPETARATLEALKTVYQPCVVRALGLHLWEYRNGPWTLLRTFSFQTLSHD